MKVQLKATCNGTSLWSREDGRTVEITDLYIGYLDDDEDFGELRAYFSPATWVIREHGLVYTDKGWIKEFRDQLLTIGFTAEGVKDVDYSEQGMQGDDYISMDFGEKFYADWKKLYGPHKEEE